MARFANGRQRRAHLARRSPTLPPPPAPPEPEQAAAAVVAKPTPSTGADVADFLAALHAGQFDGHIEDLFRAVRDRALTLPEIASTRALAALHLDDHVVFTAHVRPTYLRGRRGRVVDIGDDSVIVCLHEPVGRFKTGHIRCSPLDIHRLHPADS